VLWGSGAFLLQRPVSQLVAEFRALPVRPAVMERWLGGNAERVLAGPWSRPKRSRPEPSTGEHRGNERARLVLHARQMLAADERRSRPGDAADCEVSGAPRDGTVDISRTGDV